MDSAVLKMRALVARVGAALAAFMLVFSLLMLTSPARADSKSWMEVRFKGDSIIFTNKVHFYNMPQDDYTKGSCDSSKEYVGQTRRGGTTTRVQLEQYKGVEVCVVEGVQPLETMITSPFPGYIFTVSRDGDNLKVQGSYIPDTVNQTFYSFTFDGGIVSASGGAVTGNTVTVTDTSFEIVGNPDPSVRTSSSPSASSGATSLGAATSSGIPAATSSPSVAASDAIKPQETTSNAAAAGVSATSSAVTSSAVGSDSSNDTIIYGVVAAVGVLALGGLGWAVLQSRKKA
ncbi:hypothetical protein HMPREF1978_01920 [Actinomyces graevenitzii F0530]|uniref:Uncharacterized protein n=1 Tax=Actinomyces graevenitzii F0530 TaxID=1321817 RepID=U1PVL6_9ACTO|nr:hypothetical protein [Actinomyces graevenitzii]ERH14194.1 hypothetical protein HMPREF1978_01920 [Actinomyces graevenitzii F0530]